MHLGEKRGADNAVPTKPGVVKCQAFYGLQLPEFWEGRKRLEINKKDARMRL